MTRQRMQRSWLVLVGAVPIVFASVVMSADKSDIRVDRPVTSVGPEVAVNGITVGEYYDRQEALHARLTTVMPVGTLDAIVHADLTPQEVESIGNVPKGPRPAPLRIGAVKSIRPVSVNGVSGRQISGVYEEFANGGFTWATTISSVDADGIRVHFGDFSLPVGAEMYIFSQEGEAHGPYVGKGLNGDGDFWTNTVFSDTVVLLLSHPGPATAGDRANVRFTIDRIGHIRPDRPFANPQGHNWSHDKCGNPSCVLDANCGSVGSADQSAIAKLEWIAGAFIYTCTGGMIADTAPGQRNLLLTANHCLSKGKDAKNLETYFMYVTSSCNGDCPAWPSTPSTIGASILATGRSGDHSLLELNQDPPSGTTFLGWNNTTIANSNGAVLNRVSNPNFGPQVYSRHEVDTGTGTCTGMSRGEFIYSADVAGATDGGSSGSPVVNSAGEIVGQLFGCCGYDCADTCAGAPTNATIDGALAFYYSNVAEFLDPGTGCTPSPEVCDNGSDDDCDGDVDCADADCVDDPACQGGGCTGGQVGDPCVDDADCCSNKCKGRPGNKTCK